MDRQWPSVVTTVIALGSGHSLKVFWSANECFAPALGLSVPFDMTASGFRGYLSKVKIATVKNEDWKRLLRLTGKVRFLNRNGLLALLADRVKDGEILASAKQLLLESPPVTTVAAKPEQRHSSVDGDTGLNALETAGSLTLLMQPTASDSVMPLKAPLGPSTVQSVPLTDSLPPLPTLIALAGIPAAPVAPNALPLPPRPIPVSRQVGAEARPPVAQQLTLPAGEDWYLGDDYSFGKSYVLPPFDRGDVLLEQLRLFREHWTAERMPSRASAPLSPVTFDKRESRVLLYLGFLRLIKAMDEPKRLTLNACLNHRAVHAFIDWLGKGRDNSEGNMIE